MILLRLVFGLRKILNDHLAEQRTVGATLRVTTSITAGSITEKNWVRQYYFGIRLHRNKTGTFFHIFYNRCRDYLKPSANFGNILGKSSSRILANTAFHLNSE